jgi:nifR3 family TIM-barrel protein
MPGLVSNKGFWANLKKPIMALSPMAAITDMAFRRLLVRYAKPDVFFTEFVSVDGLCSRGRENLLGELRYDEDQRPVVAQFFGDKPENFYRCALLAGELGFDGIDINMGCPAKVVCKTGSGASLIDRPELAYAIIQAAIEGAGTLPVSVKTRIGNSMIAIEPWTRTLLAAGPAAITFHLRTRKEGTKVPAHWEVIYQAVELARGTGTLILGNGDVRSVQQAEKLAAETGVDGVLFGRAVCGNPWLFDRSGAADDVSPEDRLRAMLEHARLFEDVFAGKKSFRIMRKHLMAYASGFPGAREVRVSLQQVESSADVARAVENLRR